MQLNIISQHHEFCGRKLREYYVDNIDTIGVFGNEPFSIQFRNSSPNKVQVKLSLDGTDIITGKVADLDPHSRMWIVNGYGEMELKAWPESHQGGAAFVFSTEANSVALHIHGDLTAKGIISCAIFSEGYIPPQRDCGIAMASPFVTSSISSRGGSGQSIETERSLGPAIGAGSYKEQQIKTTTGLIRPTVHSILQVRYLWWDDLVEKLQAQGIQQKSGHPTGFHGEGINLKDTPRISDSTTSSVNVYSRFI